MSISLEVVSRHWPEAAVKWDYQCTRMHACEDVRFHSERKRLFASARAPVGWRWGTMWTARWHEDIGVWILASADISSYPRQHPDLRPWSLEYSEYPKDRLSDFVSLTIGVDPLPELVTSVFSRLRSIARVPYTDEGWPLVRRALEQAQYDRAARQRAAREFEASFRPPTF